MEEVLNNEVVEQEATPVDTAVQEEFPTRRAHLMCKCACGEVSKITDEVISDGLNWNMIVGQNHYITLFCSKCEAKLTMYLEEIINNDIPEESTEE